jgi:glycosyltransferase involved in cell wall biosynthesis
MHTENAPLVSILTPSFDQARWLPDNLRSVACQTYGRIEHIVMDGGSTDGSVEILSAAQPPVVWRSEKDHGQAHAINKAFEASSGDIIGWLNSDDAYFDARVVEDVVRFLDRNPDVDVAYGHAAKVTPDGTVANVVWAVPYNYRLLQRLDYIVQPAAFIRRSALADGFLDESFHFAMDWELWLRLGRTHRIARMDRVLAIDRVQPERKTKTWLHVLEADCKRLAQMYGAAGPWYRHPRLVRMYDRVARLGGAARILALPKDLGFSGEQDPALRRFARQVFLPRSRWPEGYQ